MAANYAPLGSHEQLDLCEACCKEEELYKYCKEKKEKLKELNHDISLQGNAKIIKVKFADI